MNGKKAKRIRRAIYGSKSRSAKGRQYVQLPSGQIVATGLRREYKDAKKAVQR